jgi:streptogrisin C
MSVTRIRIRCTQFVGAAAVVVALTGAALPASAAPAGGAAQIPPSLSGPGQDPALTADLTAVDPKAARAMATRFDIPVAEATRRLGEQQGLATRGAALEKSLGSRTGGSYLDANGQLVVTTLDASADQQAGRSGARFQRVDDSAARLDGIMQRLNQESTHGAGGLQGWYVDVPTNTVVVTVTEGASDARTQAMTRAATAFGASVRIEKAPATQAPRATEFMVGGFEFKTASGGACSVGFNTVDASNRPVVLTAGHCVKQSGIMSRNGYQIGATRTASFPTDDFGTFWNSYPSYWQPSVSVYKYNGTYVNVRGQWNAPPVGATVCKSGRTTGYTCGSITALNQTVVYPEGTIYGLVRHNNCVEPGDSGGSNISSGAFALGVTSGAAGYGANKLCGQKVGQANVSWYQPIGEALSRNGLRLVYQP